MNAFGFGALSMVWMAALAAPLVLFYFLKLKRTRQTLPSLALWRQVINDKRVNSPFQRFKRHLLLLLQLLLLALVVSAAMQPFWRGRPERMRRLPILIDCSASMAARDTPDGSTRLDAAAERVREIINGMLDDQEACLISFSRRARRRTPFTNNRRELLDALARIEVEDVASDVEDALRMTAALARTTSFDEVLLFSDGNLPTQVAFALPFDLKVHRLAPGGANVGITSLNARRAPDGTWDVFVRVECSSGAAGTAAVELARDDTRIAVENLTLAPGRSDRLVFRVPGDRAGAVTARLVTDGFDALPSDNRATLELPMLRPLHVYASTTLPAFRHALRPLADVALFPDETGTSGAGPFDLVIGDRDDDLKRSGRTRLFVGMTPEALRGLVSHGKEPTTVVDWQRNASLFRHVELRDLVVLDDPQYSGDAREGDLEGAGFEVLVHGGHGPLVVEKRESDRVDTYVLFHTERSTLPYRIGFPILVSNLVAEASHRAGLTEVHAGRTGVLAPVRLAPGCTCRIEGPGGIERSETTGADGRLSGVPAPRVGVYTVHEGGVERARIGASLLSSSETRLAAVEEIRFDEDIAVAVSETPVKTNRSLWPLITVIAFCLMLGEWLYYHRSPGWFPAKRTSTRTQPRGTPDAV